MDLPLIRRAQRADVEAVWPLARDFATSLRLEHTAFETTFDDSATFSKKHLPSDGR